MSSQNNCTYESKVANGLNPHMSFVRIALLHTSSMIYSSIILITTRIERDHIITDMFQLKEENLE